MFVTAPTLSRVVAMASTRQKRRTAGVRVGRKVSRQQACAHRKTDTIGPSQPTAGAFQKPSRFPTSQTSVTPAKKVAVPCGVRSRRRSNGSSSGGTNVRAC